MAILNLNKQNEENQAPCTVRDPSVCSCGGQALMEGILMIGPKGECQVVRDPSGELVIQEHPADPLNKKNKFFKLPFVRGVVGVIDSLRRGMKALFSSAEIAMTEEEKEEEEANKSRFEKWLDKKLGENAMGVFMTISIILAAGLSIFLFMLLPLWISGLVVPDSAPDIVKNLVEGLVRVVIFLGYMIGIAAMKDIRRVYMYHGAEHKTITCFEKGYELTVENVRPCTRFHPRCGTAFLFVVVAISILVTSIVPRFGAEEISVPILRFLANFGVRLVLLPFIMGIAYEFNRLCSKHENWLTRILRAPGLFMQRFTTKEPDDSMIEVAIVALGKALEYTGIHVEYQQFIDKSKKKPESEAETEGEAENVAEAADNAVEAAAETVSDVAEAVSEAAETVSETADNAAETVINQ